ncbi:hypothetical protein ACUALS_17720 [Vibrio sp. NH-7]
MKSIFFVVASLLSLGFFVTYQPALSSCNTDSFSFCVLSYSILKMPSWIGSFCGVFVSATLAYRYSLRKQALDDQNKRNREDLENATKAIVLLSKCFGDLGSIKFGYCSRLRGRTEFTRGMMYPYMIRQSVKPINFDPTTLHFLMKQGTTPERSPKNPNHIYNIIEKYNTIISIFETRNEMALKVNECLTKADVNAMSGSIASVHIQFLEEEFGFNNFVNFLVVTEQQIREIDILIEELSLLMYELPIILDDHFKKVASDNKDFVYRLPSFDPFTDFNKPILEPMNLLNIEHEVNQMVKKRQNSRLDWRPVGWIVY